MIGRRAGAALGLAAAAIASAASAHVPLDYLHASGRKAAAVEPLTWWLLILSIVVCVIITALVVVGVWRRRLAGVHDMKDAPPAERSSGLNWISIGLAVSTVALVISMVWTVATLAAVNGPWRKPALTMEVIGHQWWWEVRYDGTPVETLTTANEIHIPTGEPVRVLLKSGDVIHSFWIPAIDGKTDAIPGRVNETWLDAKAPGVFRGACSEYCGAQHAHMALLVRADDPLTFRRWRLAQLEPAQPPADPAARHGLSIFVTRCGACHTVRGTPAGGTVAPDLTHLMSRSTIAAGSLPNNTAGLSGWIANPQGVKPGTLMPTLYLSPQELTDVRTYLQTLK